MEPNRDAASAMEEYLEMQDAKKLPTSMADVQSKYSAIPYGWKEIDIAAVTAQLIYSQKVTIKYAGNTFSQITRNCQICSAKRVRSARLPSASVKPFLLR